MRGPRLPKEAWGFFVGAWACSWAPACRPDGDAAERATPVTEQATVAKSTPPASPPAKASSAPANPTLGNPTPREPALPSGSCLVGMRHIPAGTFWVGNAKETYEQEENPRFSSRVAEFCAGETEVTVERYEACVAAGKCRAVESTNKTCNSSKKGRAQHPINCIDYDQAVSVCAYEGARLPTEVEWEYLARGGAEMRPFPWGAGPADDQLCWKNHMSCPVKSFPAQAFGLYDVAGNVWEWTQTWFSPHPWPAPTGQRRIVKGGGWSRRFEKWLSPTLRNRENPRHGGSHLGVRCVADVAGRVCPYGPGEGGGCAFGVESVECLPGRTWNGVRCAAPNDGARCPAGTTEVPGQGCVREHVSGPSDSSLDLGAVSRQRSPEFDADCQKNQPSRPSAYRYSGGEHLARNAVGKADGCKNRDVGVGWNSSCCP